MRIFMIILACLITVTFIGHVVVYRKFYPVLLLYPDHRFIHDEPQLAVVSTTAVPGKQRIAIFYNTFLRADGKLGEKERGNGIIKGQLDMIDSQPLLANATVYYSRFGALDIDWPGCRNRTCIEIVAQPKGDDEVMALQPLHEYCVKNPLDRVVYIHSKGTYTATQSNDVLRKTFCEMF
jgi:hypothetical protein